MNIKQRIDEFSRKNQSLPFATWLPMRAIYQFQDLRATNRMDGTARPGQLSTG